MKNKKKKIVTAVVVYSLICVLAGCRFKKEIEFDATKERENSQEEIEKNENETSEEKSKAQDENTHIYADTLNVKRMGIDLDYFVQIFLGTSTIEEAEKYKPKHSLGDYYYEMDGKTIVYTNTGGIIYIDATDGAGDCYDSIVNSLGYFSNGMGNSFRQLCPDENLDTCVEEEMNKARKEYLDMKSDLEEGIFYLMKQIKLVVVFLEKVHQKTLKYSNKWITQKVDNT